jgi:hypothetical protein
MTASVRKINTANTTNLTKIKDGQANFKGYVINNPSGASVFIKLYWYTPTLAAPIPVVGTTVPDVTIGVGTLASDHESYPDGVTKAGELWLAATLLVTDVDATAAPAGVLISLFYE